MAVNPWIVSQDIIELIRKIKLQNHSPRLNEASLTAVFEDAKPFVKNRLNLGKVCKFSAFSKLWQTEKHDFCVVIPSDLWSSVLNAEQREAYLDLQLTRCEVECEPEVIEENGKKKKVKDEWGRVQYTSEMKRDDNGIPKWQVLPLEGSVGLEIFTKNLRRYGPWLEPIVEMQEAVKVWREKAKHE